MKTTNKSLNLKIVFAFAAVYIIWGTTYLAIKVGIAEIPPFLMACLRYLTASIVLAICIFTNKRPIDRSVVKNMTLGAVMLTLGQGILFWAELHLSSGLTAVLVSTLPICYILVDRKNWRNYFRGSLTIFSIIFGLAGVVLLFFEQLNNGSDGDSLSLIAAITVIISCLIWAAGSVYYKSKASADRLFPDVAWQLLGGSGACLLISLATGELTDFSFSAVSIESWGAVFYLAIAGSVVAFTASYYLLSVRPPAVVGTYAYVNPVIAVILGVLFANEKISALQIIGIVVILVAAYLSNRVKQKNH